MTHAICTRCGAMKFGCLTTCTTCGQMPVSGRQLAYAHLFSDHYFDLPQLRAWSRLVLDGISRLPPADAETEADFLATYGLGRPPRIEDQADILSPPA